MIRIEEALYSDLDPQGYRQSFDAERVLVDTRTEFQHVVIFENRKFGRVLMLDGIIQATEADEFFYQEMLTHVPLFAHGAVRDVLIIGGGDGGILREVLRHGDVRATMVEIDGEVVKLCREHMAGMSEGAFENPRGNLIIGDGLAFVRETDQRFDAIIVDSTDPIGPGEVLFTREFYQDCHRILKPGGLVVTQNGVPFFQPDELTNTIARMGGIFADRAFYTVAVPTYIGGIMTLGWGSDNPELRQVPVEEIARRVEAAGFATRYYNPQVHVASFALPNFVRDLIPEQL